MDNVPVNESDTSDGDFEDVPVKEIAVALWMRRWIVVLFVAASVSVGWAYAAYQPTVYVSSANFVVARYNPVTQATGGGAEWQGRNLHAFYEPENQKELIAEIFQSRQFLRSALDDIFEEPIRDTAARASQIQDNLTVRYDEESPHLQVTYRSTDPDEVVRILAGLLEAFPDHLASQIRTNLRTTLETAERLLEQEEFDPAKRNQLRQRMQEVRHALIVEEVTGEKFSISVIDAPGLSRSRTSFLTATWVGIAFGLLLGVIAALALHSWDTRFHTREELEEKTGLQILGSIPEHQSAMNGQVPDISEDPRSSFAEAIRLLRANLKFKAVDNPTNSMLVTSALEQDGKSTISANLARAYTLEGISTVLVDLDLRRGKIHRSMGVENDHGVTSVLTGDVDLDGALTSVDGLDVLTTGPLPPNPSELLSSEGMEELIEDLESRYERVVLDGTPALGLADMIEVSQRVDSVLVVIRAEKTNERPALDAIGSLREVDATLLGVVFNAIPEDGQDYYAGYSYYYQAYDYYSSAESAPS